MNKTTVAVVGIVTVACLIGFYIWSSHNRFYIITASQGVAYEVDRKTGQSWMLRGQRKILQESDDERRHKEEELPYDAASQITGTAKFYDSTGVFGVSLYNGSDWRVTRIILNVTAKAVDGSILWSRGYSTAVTTILPLMTGYVSVQLLEYDGVKETPWTITKVFGYKE